MHLNQVNLSYVPREDRLLLRINTLEGAEFRFWLTRAVVARMVAGLAHSEEVQMGSETQQWTNPALQQALEQFDREVASEGASASSPPSSPFCARFEAKASHYPLGQQPLLVVKVEISPRDRHAALTLTLASGQTLSINLNAGMVSSINRLLCDILKGADWNLTHCAVRRPALRMAGTETQH